MVVVIVQLNVPFCATLPLTLFVFVTDKSACLDVYEAVSVTAAVSFVSADAVLVIFVPATAVIEQV